MTAVRGALVVVALAGCAYQATAQEPDAGRPVSTVEVGPADVTQGSYKAGEYNGLQKQGAAFIGNLDVRAPARYDSDSALRWRIKGADLGFGTRSVSATVGVQGTYRLTFAFDQLRRNRSDTYQTPFDGAGGNVLTLPAGWLVPVLANGSNNARGLVPAVGGAPYLSSGRLVQPSAAQLAVVNTAAATDAPLFSHFDIFTRRTRFDGGVAYNLTDTVSVAADFRPEHKTGTKPMGTVSRSVGGDISAIIPDVIDSDHNQFTANVNYKGDRSFVQAGYYGSFFKNHVPFMAWENWASAGSAPVVNTMSSAPNNNFNQVNATGGVNVSPTTRLTADVSYSRGTQDDAFLALAAAPIVPVSSLNGLVVTTSVYGRVTSRPAKKVNLTAAYKFDNHDNRTPIRIYQYADAEEAVEENASFPAGSALGEVLAQNANANRPYSRKLNRFNGSADFNVAAGQWIKAGYDFEMIDRSCSGSWIDCADAARTRENTARAEWRTRAREALSIRVDYAYAARRAPDYNENAFLALVPYANVTPAGESRSAYQAMIDNSLTGYGPSLGYNGGVFVDGTFFPSNNTLAQALYANNNRISELVGMRRFYVADRNRNRLRSLLAWQATDQLALQFSGDLTRDDYPNSTYGLQNQNRYAADVDLSYALPDNFTASAFYTYEHERSGAAGNTIQNNSNATNVSGAMALSGNSCDGFTTLQQRNNNNKIDYACLDWTTNTLDKANTAGVGLRKQAGKLDVTANLIFTAERWDSAVTGGNWSNNPLLAPGSPASAIAAYFIPATPLPTSSTDTTELRLDGRYTVGRGAVRVAYSYLHQTDAAWMYEGMQYGSLSGVLPSAEQPFNYSVNVIGVSYILTF